MKLKSYILPLIATLSVALFTVLLILSFDRPQQAMGSVNLFNDYHSTSTPFLTTVSGVATILGNQGAIGSVVLTGTTTGSFILYDATTSNSSLRTNQTPTSSLNILIAIPIDASQGTYSVDSAVYNGILMTSLGSLPTTTITFRSAQ